MSVTYHGGQYERPGSIGPRSQAWCFRRQSKRPKPLDGYTVFISNDKGHILNAKNKSPFRSFNSFTGTWDLPCKIPANTASLTAFSAEKAWNLKEARINWTNDLMRVWLRLDPKYAKLMQHYRGCPGSKHAIELPCRFKDSGLENHWDIPGIYEDRSVYPQQTIPENYLQKQSHHHLKLKQPLSNKTHCFHSQGFSHPKELPCEHLRDPWSRTYPSCFARVGCEREYKYNM